MRDRQFYPHPSHSMKRNSLLSSSLYKLRWIAMKISNRDVLYVPKRASYSLKKLIVDRTFRYNHNEASIFKRSVPEDPVLLIKYFRSRSRPLFHFQGTDIDRIVARIPEHVKRATISKAGDIAAHRFTHRGVGPCTVDPIDWEFDPPHTSGWLWSANRHFDFTRLGFAYWYTRDRTFFESFSTLFESWTNRYLKSLGRIEWDHPFEVAARINAWIWAYFLFLPCQDWKPVAHQRFLKALGRLAHYLYLTIEYHNPGNHILLESKALALCGELFPEFRRSPLWKRKAWGIIQREMSKQICSDGVHAERSTLYHRIVAGELAELLLFSMRNRLHATSKLEGTVHRLALFQAWIMAGGGQMPTLGDAYQEDSYFRFSAPQISTFLLQERAFPGNHTAYSEQTDWALGADPVRKPEGGKEISTADPPPAMAFPEGGYFVSTWGRGGDSATLIWDCGPVGYRANPYHAHLDALSFTLSMDGLHWIIDPGYDENEAEMNQSLRGTRSHTTILVDGENQSILAPLNGRFDVWSQATARLHGWASSPECDVMVGSHDGYLRLPEPVNHIRSIVSMRGHYWFVLDRLEGTGFHLVDQRFHVAPGVSIIWDVASRYFLLSQQNSNLLLFPAVLRKNGFEGECDLDIAIEESHAEMVPNSMERSHVIAVKRSGAMPCRMSAVLAPASAGVRRIIVSENGSGLSGCYEKAEIHADEYVDRIFTRAGFSEGPCRLGDWSTDAQMVILRYQQRRLTKAFVYKGTTFKIGAEELLKEERFHRMPILQLIRM